MEEVAVVRQKQGLRGVEVTFEEVLLKKEEVASSNVIFFNDVVFEDVLPRRPVSHNACPCCSDLLGDAGLASTRERSMRRSPPPSSAGLSGRRVCKRRKPRALIQELASPGKTALWTRSGW